NQPRATGRNRVDESLNYFPVKRYRFALCHLGSRRYSFRVFDILPVGEPAFVNDAVPHNVERVVRLVCKGVVNSLYPRSVVFWVECSTISISNARQGCELVPWLQQLPHLVT